MDFPGGSVLKNPLAVRETYVRFLGQEDPLEKTLTHSSILAWRISCRGAWWAPVHGVAKSRTRLKRLSTHACTSFAVGG